MTVNKCDRHGETNPTDVCTSTLATIIHDSHTAWCSVAMVLATDYAEAYCNHQCDDTQDRLPELLRTRRELKRHLVAWHSSAADQLAAAKAQVDDLAILALRLVRALRNAAPDNDISKEAMDYLKRNDLHGKVLRQNLSVDVGLP